MPLLALEVAENEVFHAPDHLLLRYELVVLGDIVNPVELAASFWARDTDRLSICVGIGKGAAGGKTSAPAVEDALHRQQLPMLGHAHRQRPSSRGLGPPLPLSAMRDVACLDALLYAPGRVAVLVGRLAVARPLRPWLLTNEALGGSARGRGHERQRLSTGKNLSPPFTRE